MTTREPARSREERRQDTVARLVEDKDAWVATASPDGQPCLMPLSFVWDGATLLMCTRRTNPTARNLVPRGEVAVTLGHTRDVVHVEGTAEVVEGSALSAASADAFAAKLKWDPRDRQPWVYLRITPHVVKAWREVNELPDRVIMRDGRWLD
ncbi:pyridoxamine 5'-phosphate oxidase family protein [Streptomyces sp. NPDC003023]|uniref:pyridoxamine 5'-phosphate oxidase family protein n=1 Tax=Streptomyces sp. NPDC003023 TaxID=3364675 RepID=UPI0036B579F5